MDNFEVKEIWQKVKLELRELIPDSTYYLWVEKLEPVSYENGVFKLVTVLALAPQIIKQNHKKHFDDAFKKVLGHDVVFNIEFDEDLSKKYQDEMKKELKKSKLYTSPEEQNTAKVMKNLSQMQSTANLDLKYKFENFVVGENNRRAYGTAKIVAENPSVQFNPLFIYGAPGLGKTHIMQAIGHYIIFNRPDLKVKYVKTVDYVNEYMSKFSLSNDNKFKNVTPEINKFRQKYRNIDVLLIDDIQFIESKNKTIDEVFHTFDYLLNKNKQIVITSDRQPKDIMLPERLTSRFVKGVVVEITPPEYSVRIQILKNLAEQKNLTVADEVFEYIADNFYTNVRELEGAFNNVAVFAQIDNVPITLEFAQSVLKCELKKKSLTIDVIAQKIAEFFELTVVDFKSPARAQKVSKARQIAVYIVKEITDESYENIAKFFNKKHTTMIYSCDTIEEELKTNKELKKTIEYLKKILKED